jgi:hypothetical protein
MLCVLIKTYDVQMKQLYECDYVFPSLKFIVRNVLNVLDFN